MAEEPKTGSTGTGIKRDRLSSFSRWMAALAWTAMGMFGLLAVYALIVDVPALTPWFNYSMWTLNTIGLTALFLWMATNRG